MFEQEFVDWFWSRVDKSAGPDGCWYYCETRRTYATVSYKGRYMGGAHRVAYRLTFGDPPAHHDEIMHEECDNPPCCNPAHLKSGTSAENSQSMVRKGRWKRSR